MAALFADAGPLGMPGWAWPREIAGQALDATGTTVVNSLKSYYGIV